ncbi:MAG: pyruvate kinase [Acidobacteriota bacterium]|nr:pyruvate kinase [Acidobacteriota bacterium]
MSVPFAAVSHRKTKIVATIGPASDSPEMLEALMRAGMNAARLNMSHGTVDEHFGRMARIREASKHTGINVAVMVDLRGSEMRTGQLEGGAAVLVPGQDFRLYLDGRSGDARGVSVSHDKLAEQIGLGDTVFLDDGRIELEVVGVRRQEVETRVACGGTLRERKGVNIPGKEIALADIEVEEREDLAFVAESGTDYVAASFVRSAADVEEIRSFLQSCGADPPIIAKVESRAGVENLEEIVAAADGTMVARGDLGVEVPMAEVPVMQKEIIRTTVMSGKPVITATQMLDSMERNPRPTRAEVSDVANAIFDGSSALMLSGETAVGQYPVAAVETMSSLALEAEARLGDYGELQRSFPQAADKVSEAVAQASITMSSHVNAAAIVCLTDSGRTARRISKYRPDCPIVAVAMQSSVVQRLALNWGVIPFFYDGEPVDSVRLEFAIARSKEAGLVKAGDVVIATGSSTREGAATDMIRVVAVDGG